MANAKTVRTCQSLEEKEEERKLVVQGSNEKKEAGALDEAISFVTKEKSIWQITFIFILYVI